MLKPLEEPGTLRAEETDEGGRHPLQGAIAYTAFGLSLRVDPRIYVPGLERAQTVAVAEPPTGVWIDADGLRARWGASSGRPQHVGELRDGSAVILSVDFEPASGYLLSACGCGRVLVSTDGTELLCDPRGAEEEWPRILVAQALPLAATLRGLEPLHASGVVLGGEALLFTGAPGAGKSSLAAALVRRGAELLADDVVALELRGHSLVAHPGPALIYLRSAEAERLTGDERAELASPGMTLRRWCYAPGATGAPAPLARLFLLEHSASKPPIEQLSAADPFRLLASTFNLSVRTPARLRHQLDVVEALAAPARVHRLQIGPDVSADALAALIEGQMAAACP